MSQKKLTRIKSLPTQAIQDLQQHNVTTCKDFLNKSCLELMAILGYTYPQLQELILIVSKAAAPTPQNALSMHRKWSTCNQLSLSTCLQQLDSTLRGGLPAGMMSEVSGPPGCGKTQFCIMLSVAAAMCNTSGDGRNHVAYIDTEGAFSAERLFEIARCRFPSLSSEDLLAVASRVHIFTEMSYDLLVDRLRQLEEIVVDKRVRLVIVDSIASLARKEFDATSRRGVADRATVLSAQASRLKYIAESFQIPVVVTNQITTKLSHDHEVGESVVTSALGNSWSHCVNTRLLLQYFERNKRILTISKSPLCSQASFVVAIEDKGLTLDLEETEKLSKEKTHDEDPQLTSLAVHPSTDTEIGMFPGY